MRYVVTIQFKEDGSTFYVSPTFQVVADRRFAKKFWTYLGAQDFCLSNVHRGPFRVPAIRKIARH